MRTENIKIREGHENDLDQLMSIYENARKFMHSNGNMTQWNDGYPSEEILLRDIRDGNYFVGIDDKGEIAFCFTFIIGKDPTYTIIEDGKWLNDEPYGTIHRIASSGKYARCLDKSLEFCFSRINNIRIDTHKENRPMLSALERTGFIKCGVIYCRDGSPREAFQKLI